MADATVPPEFSKVVVVLHYLYPLVGLIYFFAASLVSICTLQTLSLKVRDQHVRRDVILWLAAVVVVEYFSSAMLILIRVATQNFLAQQDEIVYLLCSTIVWGIQFLVLIETDFPVWYPYYVNWAIGITVEAFLIVASSIFTESWNHFDIVGISIQGLRLLTLSCLPSTFIWARNRTETYDNDDEERQSLLRKNLAPKPGSGESETASNGSRSGYGSTDNSSNDQESNREEEDSYLKRQRESKEKIAKRLKNDGNWWTYAKGFSILFPYVWPIHSRGLQFRAVLVGATLLVSNALNMLVPRQLGLVTDSLVSTNGHQPWIEVSVYAALAFANSGACVGWIQFWLWQPLQQYSYDALNTAAHAHVMNLSSDFHETKEPSEIHQAVFQGRSVTGLVDTVCFQLIPMFIDLILVFSYLYYLFGPYMALIPASTTILYIYCTTKLVSMAAVRRRAYIADYRKEWMTAYSSLGNWRLASYHSNIAYEEQRYDSSVKKHMKSERGYKIGARLISASQGLIMTCGLLGSCYLAVFQVLNKTRSPGDFVVLLTYWAQLRGPLSFFSNMYKDISEGMMDAERLLELFQTKPTITDSKDAKTLKLGKGEIHFSNVKFAYDSRKPTLKGINFIIPGGTTVALVGETGSGKSTILKLLDRFYDVTAGSIEIDDQDIRNITLASLRSSIGVVPQDPTLFSDSIMNNVRYARLTASDEDVYNACKAAAVHDKIMSFPDGYNSKVGTQGMYDRSETQVEVLNADLFVRKLSGGEQQRVAIARAILKQPEIILLDEATSSIDTETELLIQEAFKTLCKGRTTFIVAHRLSTIMKADRIMVVKDGEIIENGSHDELLHSKGRYHDLWTKQILVKPVKEALTSDSQSASRSASRSRSSKKRAVVIVNDIEPERPKTDLATTMRTTKHEHSTVEDVSQEGIVEELCPNSPPRTPKAHQVPEENVETTPKLKPDAPEFFPRNLHLSSNVTNEFSSKTERKLEAKERIKKEKEQKKEQKREERKVESIRKAAKRAGKKTEDLKYLKELAGEASRLIVPVSGNTDEEIRTTGSDNKIDKPHLRYPRSGKRFQSKSEPADQVRDSMDGTYDLETNGMSSNDAQPLSVSASQNHRRVSAPSDPPSTSQDVRSSSRGGRVRRSRHWRIKNRVAENSHLAVASGISSSFETSNDDYTTPNAPATSPSGRATGVKFAPGT